MIAHRVGLVTLGDEGPEVLARIVEGDWNGFTRCYVTIDGLLASLGAETVLTDEPAGVVVWTSEAEGETYQLPLVKVGATLWVDCTAGGFMWQEVEG